MTDGTPLPTVTCYVDGNGKTTLKCPACDAIKRLDASKYMYAQKPFKASCKCGATFSGRFEFRTHYRKKVRLSGHFVHKQTGRQGDILVENLSLKGVGFACLDSPPFKVGDTLDLIFWLDNPKSSEIKLWVEVKSISGYYVGTQRCDTQVSQPDLGFYLQG